MATNRQIAQQALQIRRRQLQRQPQLRPPRNFQSLQQELPIARKPLLPQIISFRHELNRCNILCNYCGAQHWIEERVQASTMSSPKFSTCCEKGIIVLDLFEDPPEPLYSLLTESTSGKSLYFLSLMCCGDTIPSKHSKL
jgi:hypothetical protein